MFSVTNECVECSTRFYYDARTNKCERVHVLCQRYSVETGKCLSCYPGYTLAEGKCIISSLSCREYTTEGTCLSCYDGYQVRDGNCYVVE